MSNNGFNNDFNNDFMNYQICNSDIHSPTGKYKKNHFNSLGSIILLIIGIILAVALIVGYENSVNERKARDKGKSRYHWLIGKASIEGFFIYALAHGRRWFLGPARPCLLTAPIGQFHSTQRKKPRRAYLKSCVACPLALVP